MQSAKTKETKVMTLILKTLTNANINMERMLR